MDIEKLKAEFEKLKYVDEKLEYLNFDEHLGCYVEKNNGMPVGLAAWVNGAFYGFEQAAKVHEAEKLKGCVVVPLENVRFFSNDGENYEIHDNLVQAKDEAVRAIEYYSDRLADQQLDPRSDGNFQQISYGIVLAGSSYSVDHIVTQQDIDDGEYSYDVGTEIMSLFLVEAARGGNE